MNRNILALCLVVCCARAEGADYALEQAKAKWHDALNAAYQSSNNLVARGKIWAKTKPEWTDLRIAEWNLDEAAKHYARGERHWDAGRYEEWQKAWTQVGHQMQKPLPQLQRIERMIRQRRNE
ncbi:MAG: hypothetical protein WD872_07225 [Pirellulaceae bacterium]